MPPLNLTKITQGLDVAGSAAQVGSVIAGTINQFVDAGKRRQFEQTISLLSQSQQQELDAKIQKSKSANEKLAILTNAVTQIKLAEIQGKIQPKTEKKNDTKVIILIIGGGFALLLTAVIVKLTLKKRK